MTTSRLAVLAASALVAAVSSAALFDTAAAGKLLLTGDDGHATPLSEINRAALARAKADWEAHIAAIVATIQEGKDA